MGFSLHLIYCIFNTEFHPVFKDYPNMNGQSPKVLEVLPMFH